MAPGGEIDSLRRLVMIFSSCRIQSKGLAERENARDFEHCSLCVWAEVNSSSGDLHSQITYKMRRGNINPSCYPRVICGQAAAACGAVGKIVYSLYIMRNSAV